MQTKEQQLFFQEVIEQHKGILLKVARAYCRGEVDRQDLIQEMMIQIWRSIDRYNDQYKISTFIYRISLNVAISFYRKNSTRESRYSVLNEHLEQSPIEEKGGNEQQFELLDKFISELKEIDKALILLYLEDKSYVEIAEILGMSVSNVGTKVGRIKEKLKMKFTLMTS